VANSHTDANGIISEETTSRGILKRLLLSVSDTLKNALLDVVEALLGLLFQILGAAIGVALGIAFVVGAVLLSGIVAAGIIWLTWDHMDGIWSVALALLCKVTMARTSGQANGYDWSRGAPHGLHAEFACR
jgi:hypothetical protein